MNFLILKPLQAGWIINLYDEMISLRRKNLILRDWKKAGINNGSKMGTAGLPSLDLCDEVDPIARGRKEILDYGLMAALSINKDCLVEGYTTAQDNEGDDSK